MRNILEPRPDLIEASIELAKALQQRAIELQTPQERRQQRELDRMLQNPEDKVTLVQMTDEAFRSNRASRTAEHLTHILDAQGVPRFFSPLDRALLRGFKTFGGWLPGVAVPMVKEHMRQETANVIVPAEPDLLRSHLEARQKLGVRMNVNLLGEMVLGEDEAAHRLQNCLEALKMPELEVISVKISTLYSQISPMAREHTLRVLCDRLELLFQAASREMFKRRDGTKVPKFVYLDMEEYRDLRLTAGVFMRTLDRPGQEQARGGIALQAYLPDSFAVQREIIEWAERRVAAGKSPVTIRLVKGANMEAERVDAALHDWPQAPFHTKVETDANYKRMLHLGMGSLNAVRLGVASHNLFDLAYGMVLASQMNAGANVQFEMLEGMANHQRRALLEKTRNLLLYAPACRKDEFLNAIGYLLRRLDENTGPENFLRHAFKLTVGSEDWRHLELGFRNSFSTQVSDIPRRRQNRRTEKFPSPRREMKWEEFENEPDTDWSLPENSVWAEEIPADKGNFPAEIPLVTCGEEFVFPQLKRAECRDPSRPEVVVATYLQAGMEEINRAVDCAELDADGWRQMTLDGRSELLGRVAVEIRRARGELMRAALANGGKTLAESDPEVSEAVDFVEFYRASARFWYSLDNAQASPRGVVVVVPPWNFPIAIPCGGIAAALAAGNTVILKPASDTVLVAWVLCQCFWRAGIPKTVLQFVPCPGSGAGQALVTHSQVAAVILTGGTSTALQLLKVKPGLRLFAETGGKNVTIVSALADRELAIRHVVHSAFSHSGQKCSATSLLLLEAEVYDDAHFQRMLVDAVKSMRVGGVWELPTRMGPLIRPPRGELERGLKTLEPGEQWALRPEPIAGNPNLWTPGIKYGVTPGNFTHMTELFGPVLGVMRYESLDQAIDIANQTGYGLTSGFHSLDEREHARWKQKIQAGNLYINRGTTGAIVLRQPFGGLGKSSIGPGLKAGGPNYVAQFLRFENRPRTPVTALTNEHLEALGSAISASDSPLLAPAQKTGLLAALASYDRWWSSEFSREHDHMRLLGQDNLRRYLPFHEIRVRVESGDTIVETLARVAAARVTGARVILSANLNAAPELIALVDELASEWAGWIEILEESDAELASLIRKFPPHCPERIRYAKPAAVPPVIREAASQSGQYIADEPVSLEGRLELLWYLREQSISHDYHRYGNLGGRSGEKRKPVQ